MKQSDRARPCTYDEFVRAKDGAISPAAGKQHTIVRARKSVAAPGPSQSPTTVEERRFGTAQDPAAAKKNSEPGSGAESGRAEASQARRAGHSLRNAAAEATQRSPSPRPGQGCKEKSLSVAFEPGHLEVQATSWRLKFRLSFPTARKKSATRTTPERGFDRFACLPQLRQTSSKLLSSI